MHFTWCDRRHFNLVTRIPVTIWKTFMHISFPSSCKIVPKFSNCSCDMVFTLTRFVRFLCTLADLTSWSSFLICAIFFEFPLGHKIIYWVEKLDINISCCLDIHSKVAETVSFLRTVAERLRSFNILSLCLESVQVKLAFFCSFSLFFRIFIVLIFLCSVVVLRKWQFVPNAESILVELNTTF